MKKFRLLTAALLFAVVAEAQQEARYVPVDVQIPAEVYESMTDARQRVALENLVEAAAASVQLVTDVQINIPKSKFDVSNPAQIVDVGSLFIKPSSTDELLKLSQGPNGTRNLLTPEQIEQIRTDALFVVPSAKYPGQNYVWKLSAFFQVGAKKISIRVEKNRAAAVRTVTVVVPMLATGKYNSLISVADGLKQIVSGLRGGVSQIVGLVETRPAYTHAQVQSLIQKAKLEFQQSQLLTVESAPELRKDLGFQPDLRLFDDKLMEKAARLVEAVDTRIERAWKNRKDVEAAVEGLKQVTFWQGPYDSLDEKELAAARGFQNQIDAFARRRASEHRQALIYDPELNKLSPGLGQLMVDRAEALEIVAEAEKQIVDDVEQRRIAVRAKLQAEHPVRAKVPEWLNEQIDAEANRYYQAVVAIRYTKVAQILRAEGLLQEAFLFEKNVQFAFDQEKLMEADLKAKVQAANEFIFARPIFRPSKWIISTYTVNGETRYDSISWLERKISTASTFWRLQAFLAGSEATMKASIKGLLYSNLWNGPVGLKSLVKKDPFGSNPRINPKTREIEYLDKTATLRSRLATINEQIRQERADFEASTTHGLFGKGLTRSFLRIKHAIIKYGGGSALAFGQAAVTIGNTAGSVALAGSAPVWSPVLNLMLIGVNAGVYDFYSPYVKKHRVLSERALAFFGDFSPLLNRHLLRTVAVKGVGQTVVSAVAIPVLLAYRGIESAWVGGTSAALTVKDGLVRRLLNGRAGVPAQNIMGVVTLIEGPGLAREHYYQIEPSLAMVAVWAKLEHDAYTRYQAGIANVIATPQVSYSEFTKIFGEFVGLRESAGRPSVSQQIRENMRENSALAAEAFAAHDELYRKLLNIPKGSEIRMTEADLAATQAVISDLAQEFLVGASADWTAAQKKDFWRQRNLSEGDWKGLSRALMAETFSPAVLTPLEKMDKGFRLEVTSPSVSRMAAAVLDGKNLPAADVVRIARAAPARQCVQVFMSR